MIQKQTGGAFSGLAIINGGGGSREKQCSWQFGFTAQISPDGTLTSFVLDGGGPLFTTQYCKPTSQPTFTGKATDVGITVTMTDRATCADPDGQLFDADRTLTMSMDSRSDLH